MQMSGPLFTLQTREPTGKRWQGRRAAKTRQPPTRTDFSADLHGWQIEKHISFGKLASFSSLIAWVWKLSILLI